MSQVIPVLRTVMLFEDTPDDEMLALRALRSCKSPLEVRVARNGADALAVLGLKDSTFDESDGPIADLVISDLNMPEANGDAVLAQARRAARLAAVPFIIFSTSERAEDVRRCMDLGATAYYVKPVDPAEYIECVQRMVSKWLVTSDRPTRRLRLPRSIWVSCPK